MGDRVAGLITGYEVHIRRRYIACITLRRRNLPVGALGHNVTSAMAVPPPWPWYPPDISRPTPSLPVIADEPTGVHTRGDADGTVGAHDKLRAGVARKSDGVGGCDCREVLNHDVRVEGVAVVSCPRGFCAVRS